MGVDRDRGVTRSCAATWVPLEHEGWKEWMFLPISRRTDPAANPCLLPLAEEQHVVDSS